MNHSKGITILVALLFVGLFVIQELRFKDRINSLRAEMSAQATGAEGDTAVAPVTAAELQESVRQLNQARSELAATQRRLNTALNQISQLQDQVQAQGNLNLGSRRARLGFSSSEVPDAQADFGLTGQRSRRSWGEEQATGAPDTHQAGDISTAWASKLPDGGEEWLNLDYSNHVYLAEVRVRETYNPGAISKVAAVLPSGLEQTIWEGVTEPGEAPIEKVFPVSGNIYAKGVKVYLDTRRVPGWNEIDAVELVGRDGSRQWASHATASSSYADPR